MELHFEILHAFQHQGHPEERPNEGSLMQSPEQLERTSGAAAVVGIGARVADANQPITIGALAVTKHALPVASHVVLAAVLLPAMQRSA